MDVLFDRIQRRGMEDPPMERDQLLQWAEIFQAPAAEDSHSSIRVQPWKFDLQILEVLAIGSN
jgi:hypothetical protein